LLSSDGNNKVYSAREVLGDTDLINENQVEVTITASYNAIRFNTSVSIGEFCNCLFDLLVYVC